MRLTFDVSSAIVFAKKIFMYAVNEHQGNEVCKFAENSYGKYTVCNVLCTPFYSVLLNPVLGARLVISVNCLMLRRKQCCPAISISKLCVVC